MRVEGEGSKEEIVKYKNMITFCIALVLLVLGYLFYGRVVERVFGIDENRPTPAQTMADGVDYVPMKPWKLFLIQFLNIAGVGPICGAIMGAQFGTASYLWIVFGCIFGGAVHDYLSGMILRVRNIFSWLRVAFWASSKMTKAWSKVRPRIKAKGAISIVWSSR